MKKKENKHIIVLCIFITGFLLSTSSLNTLSTKALQEREFDQYSLDSFDRSNWKWFITEVVSTESASNSWDASLAVDTSGNVHIAWNEQTDYSGSGSDYDILYKRWETTSSWTTTEIVSTESINDSFKPDLTVDSAGNVHIAWIDLGDYAGSGTDWDILYKYWNASTSVWNATEVVSTESTSDSQYASLAVDSWGNVHIAWMDETDYAGSGSDWDVFYKLWDSSSSAWNATEVVSTESTSDSNFPSLAVDSLGSVHIAWNDLSDYAGSGTDWDIFYKYWNVSTSVWNTTEVVSTESTSDSWDASLAVDIQGNIYMAWMDETNYAGAGTDKDIFYKYFDAVTSVWNVTEVVSTESTSDSRMPSLAVDSAGFVHIAWEDYTDYTPSGTDADIFCKHFAGPPLAPELSPILPNPTDISTISLDWNDVTSASVYYVYRSTSNILSVEDLTPIGDTVTTSYDDTLPAEGIYFYVVVANNFAGNSTPSNCENIEYIIPQIQEFVNISSLIICTGILVTIITRLRKKKTKLN